MSKKAQVKPPSSRRSGHAPLDLEEMQRLTAVQVHEARSSMDMAHSALAAVLNKVDFEIHCKELQ